MRETVSPDVSVFDRRIVRLHRDRAARKFGEHDFLMREIGDRLVDRLADVARDFPLALDLGCRGGVLGGLLTGRGKVGSLIHADLSPSMARAVGNGPSVVADEEVLPFQENRFDLVASLLGLHWVNDLPGALVQINRVLKPDGLFIAAMFGGDTLSELRQSLMDAELDTEGGVSPRVSPFADLRDAGGLLQRAGFALPVADSDTVTVTYADPFALMKDLRGMGETNAVHHRRKTPTRRATLMRAAQLYHDRHADADGRIPATFQVLYLTGWRPHETQQQPLKPGSATGRLADALGTEERGAGEKARPK